MKTKEVWKDIKNYEGLYQVSNLGNVKSLKCGRERILKAGVEGHGYYNVVLTKDGKRKTKKVHQLVAEAFLNHTPCGHKLVVNHINNNSLDNSLSNLEIVTQRENLSKDKKTKYTGVTLNKRNNKWMSRIWINGKSKYLGVFTNELEASNAYQKELKIVNNNN